MTVTNNNKSSARNYKPSTIRRLDTLSCNECAHPDCNKQLIAEDEISIISKICHIYAANIGGARYDATMTDDERRAYNNLILLCDEHHTIIDNKANEHIYTTELLKKWKQDHVNKSLAKLPATIHPLSLNTVINAIGQNFDEILDLPEVVKAPNTVTKILHNNIIVYEPIIKDFAIYQGKLNKIYEEIEKEGSVKKQLVLQNISSIYYKIPKEYSSSTGTILNADSIIDSIYDQLIEKIESAPNKLNNMNQESLYFSLMIIIVDAFIRCKILEEPPLKI